MTYVLIDVHHRTHTCPANPEPHPYDTLNVIIERVDGGPCRQPITLPSGDTLACGRRVPADRQCPACRVTTVQRRITTTHLGHHGPDAFWVYGCAA